MNVDPSVSLSSFKDSFALGLNPSVFGLWLFFLLFIFMSALPRRQIVLLSFVLAISFYLGNIGLGSLRYFYLQDSKMLDGLSKGVMYVTAIAAMIAGIFSIYDWWILQKRLNVDRLCLQIKSQTAQPVLSKTALNLLAVFFIELGFWFSLFEWPFVDHAALSSLSETLRNNNAHHVFSLLLIVYHSIFVLPLIFVLGITIVLREVFRTRWLASNSTLRKFKIVSAAAFLGLGLGFLYILTV